MAIAGTYKRARTLAKRTQERLWAGEAKVSSITPKAQLTRLESSFTPVGGTREQAQETIRSTLGAVRTIAKKQDIGLEEAAERLRQTAGEVTRARKSLGRLLARNPDLSRGEQIEGLTWLGKWGKGDISREVARFVVEGTGTPVIPRNLLTETPTPTRTTPRPTPRPTPRRR